MNERDLSGAAGAHLPPGLERGEWEPSGTLMIPPVGPSHGEGPGPSGPSCWESRGAERRRRGLGARVCSWGVLEGKGMARSLSPRLPPPGRPPSGPLTPALGKRGSRNRDLGRAGLAGNGRGKVGKLGVAGGWGVGGDWQRGEVVAVLTGFGKFLGSAPQPLQPPPS